MLSMYDKVKELKGYMSVRQVADKIGMRKQGIKYLIREGLLRAYYIDNFYVITEKDFEKFIEERQNITDGRYKNIAIRKS